MRPVRLPWEPDRPDTPACCSNAQALRNPDRRRFYTHAPAAAMAALAAMRVLWFFSSSTALIAAATIALAATCFCLHLAVDARVVCAGHCSGDGRGCARRQDGYETMLKSSRTAALRAAFRLRSIGMDGFWRAHPTRAGGTRKFVGGMFADIRGYATAANADPERTSAFLTLLRQVVGLILARREVVSFMVTASWRCWCAQGLDILAGRSSRRLETCSIRQRNSRRVAAEGGAVKSASAERGRGGIDIGSARTTTAAIARQNVPRGEKLTRRPASPCRVQVVVDHLGRGRTRAPRRDDDQGHTPVDV